MIVFTRHAVFLRAKHDDDPQNIASASRLPRPVRPIRGHHNGNLQKNFIEHFDIASELAENMHAVIWGVHAMAGRFAISCAVIGVVLGMTGATVSKSLASDIIDDWANIKTPPAPELKTVTVDPKTTALFMGDLVNQVCGKRPRCVAALPAMKKLLGEARAAKVAVIYSIVPNTTPADIMTDVAPAADEPSVQSGVDKFFKTNLEQILKDKGIQTIIMVGTSAEGLITYTGGEAALRGFNVIVPVDGVGSIEAFAEQYVAWHMTHAPIVSPKVTMTRTGMIKF